jgi:hypothetical protein
MIRIKELGDISASAAFIKCGPKNCPEVGPGFVASDPAAIFHHLISPGAYVDPAAYSLLLYPPSIRMDYPTEARVATVYREIFGPEWTIQKLAHSAIQGHLLQKAVHGPPHAEVVGRSIVWKVITFRFACTHSLISLS